MPDEDSRSPMETVLSSSNADLLDVKEKEPLWEKEFDCWNIVDIRFISLDV